MDDRSKSLCGPNLRLDIRRVVELNFASDGQCKGRLRSIHTWDEAKQSLLGL
jgi:hypothetical protein